MTERTHGRPTMAPATVRFDLDQLWRVLDRIDPVSALVDQLTTDGKGAHRLTYWPDPAGEQVLVADPWTERSSVVPALLLRTLSVATRAVFAARQLLGRGVVTAAVLGSGVAAQLVLGVLARHMSGLSHVALYGGCRQDDIAPRVLDQLDLSGIEITIASSTDAAVRGANLVIACDPDSLDLRFDWLSPRCVLVTGVGVDLPDALVDQVGGIYVDDAGLLPAGRCRGGAMLGDFRDLLDAHSGPTHLNRVVLVELIDNQRSDAAVAGLLHLGAQHCQTR